MNSSKIYQIIIISLFIISNILYLNLNGLPLENPGNIKAADPFYHALMVENILDTKQWNYYDFYISLGKEKYTNTQPPLYYIISAILTTFTNLPPWITLYFIICLTMALYVIIIYLLTEEIFENKKIAIISAILTFLPIPLYVWFYPLYIGLWLQLPSNFFILSFLWLLIKYIKKKEQKILFFISLSLIGVLLVHPQDLSVLFLPCLYLAYDIIKTNFNNKKKVESIKKIIISYLILSVFFLIIFFSLLPRFLFVWGDSGSNQFKLGYFGFRSNYFTNEYSGGLVFPLVTFIPIILIILWILSLIQLYLNKEKYKIWIFANIYFFIITYILPIIIEQPYYFARLRTLTPYIIYPSISYIIYTILTQIENPLKKEIKNKLIEIISIFNIFIIIIFCLILYNTYPQYNSLKEQLKYEHITKEKWNAYKWIQENTEKNSKILFFGGVFQSEQIYTKRITGLIDLNEYAIYINEVIKINNNMNNTNINSSFPIEIKGVYGADTLRSHKIEKNFFSYESIPEPSNDLKITDFDYIFFTDLNNEIANANSYLINEFQKLGYVLVYNKDRYSIVKKIK